ncbi:MAG: ORF6N domain-containing protein [Dehalococcoidia bacterium]
MPDEPAAAPLPTLVAVAVEQVESLIYQVRSQRVILDEDLAALYGVETRIIVRAVTRHQDRFPADFMFRLSGDEARRLRSHRGISNTGRGGRRYAPYVFTEQGVAMLSSVLSSPRAVQVNIEVMRTFVKLRALLASNGVLSRRLDELEAKYDDQFRVVFDAIRELMTPPPKAARPLGFPRIVRE